MIKIGKRFENFANSLKAMLDELEYFELEGVTVTSCVKEGTRFEDEEDEPASSNLYYLEVKMPNDVLVYRSKEYLQEKDLLADKESIIKDLKELFNDKKSHFWVMFETQQIPFEDDENVARLYSSYAKMINSYEDYLKNMSFMLSSKRIFNDKIHRRITSLKELFIKNFSPSWIHEDYKFAHYFDVDGKCHIKVYRNNNFVAILSR